MTTIDCPICDARARETLPRSGDFLEITCLNCGRFRVTGTAVAELERRPVEERLRLLSQAQESASGESLPIVGGN